MNFHKNRVIGYTLVFFAILFFLLNVDKSNRNVTFLVYNILFDVFIFLLYLCQLSSKGIYLFPSSIFVVFFYIYEIMGKAIWIYRENNWFNEEGTPERMALYFSAVGIILIIISVYGLIRGSRRKFSQPNKKKAENYLFITRKVLNIFVILTFIGAFIFTSGFQIIPLLSDKMDKARVDLVSQDSGGRGFGFFFLLFGILGNSLALYSLPKIQNSDKRYYIFCIIIMTFLLALYSGRFLPLMPFMIYIIGYLHNRTFNIRKVSVLTFFGILGLLIIMYFGAIRQFGGGITIDLATRYLIADLFPEFRMSVYIDSMNPPNLVGNFLYTIVAGLLPGFIFSPLGINKNEYFRPIGIEILKMTQFDPSVTPGIRTSLFGELFLTGGFIFVFLILIAILLLKIDNYFFSQPTFKYKKFKYISFAIFLGFAIPYGSLFLVSVIEWAIILNLVAKYFIYERK